MVALPTVPSIPGAQSPHHLKGWRSQKPVPVAVPCLAHSLRAELLPTPRHTLGGTICARLLLAACRLPGAPSAAAASKNPLGAGGLELELGQQQVTGSGGDGAGSCPGVSGPNDCWRWPWRKWKLKKKKRGNYLIS